MAETILIELFKEVGSFVFQAAKQEINLLVGVDKEVQNLQGKLRMMKATLDDAEERHAVKRRTEKLWFEQLQNQYYEMDDILDTWNTARIRAEIEKEEGKPADNNASAVVKKKVCSFVPSPSCCFNLPLRHDVGHMIRKLNEKLDMVFKDKETDGIDFNRQPDVVERPITTSFVDVSHIIGRDIYRDNPLRNLLGVGSLEETNSYRVISLVGMGGVGKTTLAQLAYNHPDVLAHFQQRMWICVSDPFDQCKVAKAIIKEVDPKRGPLDDFELQTLLCEIQKLIKDKKFFLVLDDVWTADSKLWEPFKFALKNGVHGSRILVTTRKQEVAEMMEGAPTIDLGVLSEEDCWLIFSKIAFSKNEQSENLEDLGRKLAIKCKGLPLAAKTLGSLMQHKRSRGQWNEILQSHMWELKDIENCLLTPLLLSYYELPAAMRRCFLYCAVFAKDYLFSRDKLVLHWMAQGYIEPKANVELEVIAEEYFEKLAMRSFFQDFKKDKHNDDKIIGCKMHDIVHDFALSMTKNESFKVDDDKKLEIDCQSARHLHLKISRKIKSLESINRAKNLRTLYLSGEMYHLHRLCEMNYEFGTLLSNSFDHFKCLRTLILDCPIKKLPDAVGNLIHLRCLHMFKNVVIEELPETICNLCNLQTLNIENGLCFMKLPQGICKLINLRHFIFHDDYNSYNLVFPKGIGKLIGLRTLSRFNVSDKDDREGCKFGELKNLNQLRGFLTIGGIENVVNVDEAQNAQLKDKIHLCGLVLLFKTQDLLEYEEGVSRMENDEEGISRMENDVKVLNALEPPPNLQYLEIRGYMGNTIYPNWMMSWTTLKNLQLIHYGNLEHLPSLGQLPFLEVLVIKRLPNVKKVGDEFLGIEDSKNKKDIFPKLKSLKFKYLENWEEWIGMGGTGEEEKENDNGIVTNPIIMPCLQSLRIFCCDNLKSLPDYLLTAPLLKELDISCSKLLQERYQNGTLTINEVGYVGKDEAQNAQLKDKIHIRGLNLSFKTPDSSVMKKFFEKKRMKNDVEVLNALELPPNLECLGILGYMGNTIYPDLMMSWTTLKKLKLNECENLECLPSLGQLPFLEVLETAWLHNVKKVGGEFLAIEDSKNKEDVDIIFPNLKSLEFVGLGNWEEWIGMGGTGEEEEEENDNGIVTNPIIIKIMPRLQSLTIEDCRKLKSLPDYLLTAPLLKELKIPRSDLLKEHYQIGTGDNWHEISHISNIKFSPVYPQFDIEMNSFYEVCAEDDLLEISEEDDVPEISEEDDVV